jgi:hypothetical protein
MTLPFTAAPFCAARTVAGSACQRNQRKRCAVWVLVKKQPLRWSFSNKLRHNQREHKTRRRSTPLQYATIREGITMEAPTPDGFIKKFHTLLDPIAKESFTLAQWQYAYGQVIYIMGLKILQMFPEAVAGCDPGPDPVSGSGGAEGGGGNYYSLIMKGGGEGGGPIINIAIAALSLNPDPTKKS